MSARSKFAQKKFFVPKDVRNFDITSEYVARKPFRGISEIEPILELTDKFNSFVSGGYARYCMSPSFNPIKPVDLDIFSSDMENHLNIVQAFRSKIYRESRFKSDVLQREVDESDESIDRFWHADEEETDFAISFRIDVNYYPGMGMIEKIQFIKPSVKRTTTGALIDILNNFDFTICKAALITPKAGIVHIGFDDDEYAKLLRVTGKIRDPLATFARITRYCKKGYNLTPLTMLKVLETWRNMDHKGKFEQLLNMAKFQLENVLNSSESDKPIDQYEASQIGKEISNIKQNINIDELELDEDERDRLRSIEENFHAAPISPETPEMMYAGMDEKSSKVTLKLDRDGQLLNAHDYELKDYL